MTNAGSIASSSGITIANGATFNVSGLSSTFALGAAQTLSNSAPTAQLSGNFNAASGTVALTYAAGLPALNITNGVFTLSAGTAFQINNTGALLEPGSYNIVSVSSTQNIGQVSGTVPAVVTVSGAGVAAPATLQITGGALYLVVGATTNSQTPTTLALSSSSPTNNYLSSVNFTASVQTNGVTASDATGSVVFSENGTPFSTSVVTGGIASSSSLSSLPIGADIITATYYGDDAYQGSSNTLNQTVTDIPPVAGPATFWRHAGNSLTIPISQLLANVTDVEGASVSLAGVGVSTNGVTLVTNGSALVYNNPNPVNDQFTYTVTDPYGGTSTGLVNVNQKPIFSHHNILLIIGDDEGIDNFDLYNTNPAASIVYTPNLDSLAKSGVTFTHFYARPSCSVSRATLITGRDAFRTGVEWPFENPGNAGALVTLSSNEYTLPRAFTTNAPEYSLANFGKFHLGLSSDLNSPWTIAGWTNFQGYLGATTASYYNWTKISNGVSFNTTNYSTDDEANDTISFINSQGTNRWFVWLGFNAAHEYRNKPPTNLLVTPRYLALSGLQSDITANGRPYYEAMIQSMDTEIGRLVQAVDTNDTDIIFLGDNWN